MIPARGGSKRIPGKNTRHFLGKPAIAYAIAAARRSQLFDRVVVSTDSSHIAATALAFGAEVPFSRPAGTRRRPYCGTLEVFRHALQYLDLQQNVPFAFACCIYPTAVLVDRGTLASGRSIGASASPRHNYCFSVCEFRHPIERALRSATTERSLRSIKIISSRLRRILSHTILMPAILLGNGNLGTRDLPIFTGESLPYILIPTNSLT